MAEFKISRFRYTWKGNWNTSTAYIKDDVVRYGGSSYVCIRAHTSSVFQTNQEFLANPSDTDFSPAWTKMTDGRSFLGDWSISTTYAEGDIFNYGGNLYLVVTPYVSASIFEDDLSNLALYVVSSSYNQEWQINTRYAVNDLIKYGGTVYRCISGHTSAATTTLGLESNQSNWEILYEGMEYRGSWVSETRYRSNDLVKFGGSVFRCTTPHTSNSTVYLDNNWDLEILGLEFYQNWLSAVYYSQGSLVLNGGYLFYATKNNINNPPINSIVDVFFHNPTGPVWQIVAPGIKFRGVFTEQASYKTGDVVQIGGNLYTALVDIITDGSTLSYLDSSNWNLLYTASSYKGQWEIAISYSINDNIVYFGNLYKANLSHVSTSENNPGDNLSGFNYWDLVIPAGSQVGLLNQGDLLTYNEFKLFLNDESSLGPTNLPIGAQNELVTVDNDSNVAYSSYEYAQRIYFVSTNGINDELSFRGISENYPFKTIQYACDRADDGYNGTTTIRVLPGKFDEVLPIIVPKKTAVVGAELRSTTISVNLPNYEVSLSIPFLSIAFQRLILAVSSVIARTSFLKSQSNTESQILNLPGIQEGTSTTIPVIENLANNVISYLNFYIESTGSDPVITGSNTLSLDTGFTNSSAYITANKEFLKTEITAFLSDNYPLLEFNNEYIRRDFDSFIDAIAYDLIYSGNYKTILFARRLKNRVLGSAREDMFYLRDSSGLRNCTVTGLTGELSPPNVFDIYRIPLGRSFCSLDPGWGPADNRTWILTRSPYIQGVTTIGTGCVGQKIDGALHNGGNKSMVSNDFTQVISDGIGAWVLNNGRAELVSVFTYYAHIGYFAEDGGVMRSLNGNCSYGTFGAIAEGIDATEVPASAVAYTRAQQASVDTAFAGDFVDEIQILEFANCGENYTTATGTFRGAGINASVLFEDFRDDAVFEARLLDAFTTGVNQQIGGSGYVVVQNNAQTGTASTITIAANDANSIAQYQGMRIILTSGAGTGQYGYITAYDNVTKVVSVTRESDDQPGWDHVQSGKLPTVPLLPNTTYRIEPRVIFSAPPYAAQEITVPVNTTWSEIVFGDTTETYSNVPVNESGTGTTIDVVAALARFNVNKIGRNYTLSIANGGAGYEIGQLLTIDGSLLGGASPINDLLIEVTVVSDDSTNSILSATRKTYGTGEDAFASSGKFVVISTGGNAFLYSSDGETWVDSVMPSSGDWKCLAAGLNRFVAIRKGSNAAASSLNGVTWTTRTMPASREWNSCVYGGNVFLAVATDSNSAAYSLNGTTWTTVTLPSFGDSTLNEWVDVAYGKNRFVVIANSNNIAAVGTYNSTLNTWSWTGQIMDVIADSSSKDWVSVAYGNDRFVAISSTGDVGYSFDGAAWLPATMPSQDGSTAHNWKKIRYAQGVFFAVGDTGSRDVGGDVTAGPSNFAATSFDGIVWTSRELASTKEWQSIAFGNPYTDARDSTVGRSTPVWVAIDNTNTFNKIQTGARALGRVTLSSGIIRSIKMWDPGSGYREGATVTLIDPNNSVDAIVDCRINDGVIAQPSWLNRGLGYRTATTTVTITGDGYADVIPAGKFFVINDLVTYPGPGASLTIGNLPGFYTLVAITPIGPTDRGLAARIRVSPELKVRDNLQHLTPITIRTQFSQIRITGHDFLDIGTGNFEQTNYPELYSGLYTPAPENEVVELERGRVFYTSTDQSGNFRAGELFAVEQATGIVTISADFFDLGGLSELRLGGIRVGGTGAVIREFSTDPLFIEDSNNIVPTQRAIRAFLAGRLSIGGSEIAVGSFIAGTILVGPDRINNVASIRIIFPLRSDFDGPNSNISGSILAQTMFFRSFGLD